MNQEDINDLIAKNPSPEALISRRTIGYSREFVEKTVDRLFRKYASDVRQEALKDLHNMLRLKSNL